VIFQPKVLDEYVNELEVRKIEKYIEPIVDKEIEE